MFFRSPARKRAPNKYFFAVHTQSQPSNKCFFVPQHKSELQTNVFSLPSAKAGSKQMFFRSPSRKPAPNKCFFVPRRESGQRTDVFSPSTRKVSLQTNVLSLPSAKAGSVQSKRGGGYFAWKCSILSAQGTRMPSISRFFGITIYMYPDDHNPPHFHAICDDRSCIVESARQKPGEI